MYGQMNAKLDQLLLVINEMMVVFVVPAPCGD
jgi:hypothetical protein